MQRRVAERRCEWACGDVAGMLGCCRQTSKQYLPDQTNETLPDQTTETLSHGICYVPCLWHEVSGACNCNYVANFGTGTKEREDHVDDNLHRPYQPQNQVLDQWKPSANILECLSPAHTTACSDVNLQSPQCGPKIRSIDIA